MVVNCQSNVFRFFLRFSIEATDDTLQFREFSDHLGDQVAFTEFGRAVSGADTGMGNPAREPLFREPAGQFANSIDLFAVAPKLFLVGYRCKFRKIVGQPTFLIRLPEESRIREACTQHTLVPRADQSGLILVQIDYRQEIRSQRAVLAFQREVLLVVTHHGD